MDTFREIVDAYSSRVFNHCLKMLKNREDAEEAAQDVFMKIYRGIEHFRGDARLSTWIWRITVNVCYTRLSKRIVRTDSLDEIGSDAFDELLLSEIVTQEEKKSIILKALTALPSQQSSVLLLFYFDELSYKEIANALNIPEGTVATILFRGRENLKKVLLKFHKESFT